MIYSVYDYTRRTYDYYDAPGPDGTHAGSPPAPATGKQQLGAAPERAAWKLPVGAKKLGSGELPQGRIASLAGADLFSDPIRLGMYGALAYLAWRAIR